MTGAVGVVGAAGAAAVSIGWTVTTNKDGGHYGPFPALTKYQ